MSSPLPALASGDIGALVALVEQGRLDEAERQVRRRLRVHPDAGMLWKILGVALMRQGKEALPALRRAAESMPRDAEAHGNLGAALRDQGRWSEASTSLHRALELAPDDVGVLVDAADVSRQLGRPRDAVSLYRRALRLDPRQLEPLNHLGNAYLELGEYAAAADSYRAALQIEPSNPALLCNLGRVLRDVGKRREAASLYARAVELDPSRADSHCSLGNVLYELRRVDDAVSCYRRALDLQPGSVPAHVGLGAALRMLGGAAEAEESCRAALAIDPDAVEALSLMGELHADRGRFAAAEELFRRAMALDPNAPSALCSLAAHRKMTPGDTAWLAAVEALLRKRLPLEHAISLRYALAKYHDDLAEYDAAFGHYRQANELTKQYGARYDRAALVRRLDSIIGGLDAASIRRIRSHASDSDVPVFIIGMPRSGTSLAEQILASHPAVSGAGELPFWEPVFAEYESARDRGLDTAVLVRRIARDYMQRVLPSAGGALRVVDKMPANFMFAGFIHALFPRARIIHMQRHPIDTCLSMYFQNFFNMGPHANDLDDLAHYFVGYRRIMRHWRAVLPQHSLLEVPYEALIEDPEGWSRRMVDFAGLPWDARCLDFHRTDRVVITASKWQVRQKIHSASAGRWKHYRAHVGPLEGLLPLEGPAEHSTPEMP